MSKDYNRSYNRNRGSDNRDQQWRRKDDSQDIDSNNNKEKFNKPARIGIKKLEELLEKYEKHPEKIILSFEDPKYRLEDYLSAPSMSDGLIIKLAIVLNEAFKCNSVQAMARANIDKIVESVYFKEHLHECINKTVPHTINYNLDLIETTMNLCKRFLLLRPICRTKIASMKDRLELLVTRRLSNPRLTEMFDELVRLDTEASYRNQMNSNRPAYNQINYANIPPPNDFTEMSIVPKLEDINSNKTQVFLRQNLTNEAYKSVHLYLDTQFRLLREDFLGPLRDGVQKLRAIVSDTQLNGRLNNMSSKELRKELTKRISRIESLSAYFGCSIENSIPTDHGIVYQVRLSPDKTKSINWDASKKLLFGSLICMSDDYFEKRCLIGSICERDPKKLKEGIILVKFNIDVEDQWQNEVHIGKDFIMLETSAYFESYKYVLQALVSFQHDGEENFPFKENIVFCQNRSMPMPKYLTNMAIDFRPLVDKNKTMDFDHANEEYVYKFSPTVSYASQCFVSNQKIWPSAEQMGLDKSQYEAVKLALENKLALIQGPPGTGKTFIGVKLVELLLHNKNTWWNRAEERRRPILMICYTNHALDQFLEFCIDQCKLTRGVVRVGGRSRSEKLESFKLSNIKRTLRTSGQIEANIHHQIKREQFKLVETKKALENESALFSKVALGGAVLRFSVLANYMEHEHMSQLFANSKNGPDFALLEWLGFFEEDEIKEAVDSEDEDDEITTAVSNMSVESAASSNVDDISENTDRITADDDQNEEENVDENDERMLEDDFKYLANIEKAFEEMSTKQRNLDVITCEEIEELRKAFKKDVGNDWQTAQSKKEKRREKVETKSEAYMRKMFESQKKNIGEKNIHLEPNINRLGYGERFLLYLSWLEMYKVDKKQKIDELSNKHNLQAQLMQELRLQEDRQVLEDAYIVAMTTTGSSRYHSVLKDIGPRIVIVEEAAEVFESHIVASLSKNCEHLILIGDHVQLRPNPSVYKLAKDYKFDVSLFERLINNNTKKIMLSCQHRMRPEISQLMKHFYKDPIQDHDSVQNRDQIIGLRNNIFFITHDKPEEESSSDNEPTTTKINKHEAKYAVKLAQYLIKQRQFKPEQITILTMYLGQMFEIKKLIKDFKIGSVKCMTVDNYQGEENEIIILSLVRSRNSKNRIGFLNVENRVCVALSRARSGFYVIGNLEFICKNEKDNNWKHIINGLIKSGAVGDGLTLSCGKHDKEDLEAKSPSDFDRRPNGGCNLPCEFRLKCGHQCTQKCHPYDREHIEFKCQKLCDKMMPCGHPCKKTCSHNDECNSCGVLVRKKVPGCGHIITKRCDLEVVRSDCKEPCEKVHLKCMHQCTKRCGDLNCGECEMLVPITLACRHEGEKMVKCCEREKALLNIQSQCPAKTCGVQLSCGHVCKNSCADCLGGYIHKGCSQKCSRFLFCGHKCPAQCSNECEPCTTKCENRCVHSRCQKKCSEPCVPCREPCTYKCQHLKCTKKCGELCDRLPCSEPCQKQLSKCGHPCIGFCGEPCPPLCRICQRKKLCEIVFGSEDEPDARFVWLEDCGHCIEASGMDYWMESRYGPNAETDTKNNSIQLPECPRCKTPIRRNLRYSNYVKTQLELIEKIKLKQYGDLQTNKADLQNLKKEINIFYSTNLSQDVFTQNFKGAILSETDRDEMSYKDLVSYRNVWTIYKQLEKVGDKIKKLSGGNPTEKAHLDMELKKLQEYILVKDGGRNSTKYDLVLHTAQKSEEILNEVDRIEAVLNYFTMKNEAQRSPLTDIDKRVKVARHLAQLEVDLVKRINPYKGEIKRRVEESFKELQTYIKVELSKEERAMIVEAMGLGKGHWYKCPNGHPYAIGDCGGAMQKARCPDCNAEIGGQQHRLTDGNTHAGDFDGSSAPAWPQNHLV